MNADPNRGNPQIGIVTVHFYVTKKSTQQF